MDVQRSLNRQKTLKDIYVSSSASHSPKRFQDADVENLISIIEVQRESLEQRAEIIRGLQNDIDALGQKLAEERERAEKQTKLYQNAYKELEALKSINTTAVNTPKDASPLYSDSEQRQLVDDHFQLRAEIDNLQHLLDLRTQELMELKQIRERQEEVTDRSSRTQRDENLVQLLQSQIGWLNKENKDKGGKIERLERKVKQMESDVKQAGVVVKQMEIEAQNRSAEIDRKAKEIKELKERIDCHQLVTQKSRLPRSTITEEDLRFQMTSFNTQALNLANRLTSVQRAKFLQEKRLKSQEAKRKQLNLSMESVKKQLEDEQDRKKHEIDELEMVIWKLKGKIEKYKEKLQGKDEDLVEIRTKMKEIQQNFDQKSDQNAKLTLENEKINHEFLRIQSEMQILQSKLSTLEADLTAAEVHTADYTQIRKENSRLRTQILEKDTEINTLKVNLAAEKEENENLNKNLENSVNLRNLWETGIGELEKESKSKKSLLNTCLMLKKALNELNETKKLLEEMVSFRQVKKKEEKIWELEGDKRQMMGEVEKYLRNLMDLQKENKSLREELQVKVPSREEMDIRLAELQLKEASLKAALGKAKNATRAIESDLLCIVCLSIVTEAVVCNPCGHFYCKRCRVGYHPSCQQCGERVRNLQKVSVLDEIAAKVKYRKKAVEQVQST